MEDAVIDRIAHGLATSDAREVEGGAHDMTLLGFLTGSFSGRFFDRFLDLLLLPEFGRSDAARHVIFACVANWDAIEPDQRQALLDRIEESLPRWHDDMSCFFATELLGKYYCDDNALAALMRLRALVSPYQRACIPHGFECLALECRDRTVALRAYEELVSMQNDESVSVRAEAQESLKRLAAAYPPYSS